MNNIIDICPLHDTQRWGIDHNGIGRPGVYSAMFSCFRITGKIDTEKLEKAINVAVAKYDALRFVIDKDENGEYVNKLIDEYEAKLNIVVLNGETYEEKEKHMIEVSDEAIKRVGRIEGNCVFDFTLCDFGNDEYILIGTFCHIIMDGVSSSILMSDICMIYNGMENKTVPMDYISIIKESLEFRKSEEGQKQLRYWEEKVKDYDSSFVKYPTENRKMNKGRLLTTLPFDVVSKLARTSKVSTFVVVLFLYHLALATAYGIDDTIVNVADSNRSIKTRQSVGLIMASYATRLKYAPEKTLSELWDEFRVESRESCRNINTASVYASASSFSLSYINYTGGNKAMKGNFGPDATAETYNGLALGRIWDFFVVVGLEMGEKILIRCGYDPDTFSPEFMDRFTACFNTGLKCLTENGDMTFEEFKKL